MQMFSFPQLVISKMEKIKSWLKLTWGTFRYQRISLKEFSKAEVGLNLFTWQGVLFSLMERSMEDLSQLKTQISRLHQMFIQSFLIHDLERLYLTSWCRSFPTCTMDLVKCILQDYVWHYQWGCNTHDLGVCNCFSIPGQTVWWTTDGYLACQFKKCKPMGCRMETVWEWIKSSKYDFQVASLLTIFRENLHVIYLTLNYWQGYMDSKVKILMFKMNEWMNLRHGHMYPRLVLNFLGSWG